ncbi:SGNH/GDSL hydrolase family protein [Microbacterium gallinarum]|jgi:lysophospholipase L1-like esterase|uniref:SGNH/GDSL hydrolase family protein n=1 Tax=Microbacterium gallinarum TaxID=2762209 RepID=A0ABR8WZJ1_9MICO|nr:SGNH/GDSL hydrolase family protein [Microbacterium gallinarum]MBD8022501.1 SGNH/GDSL hydrolase family protein [Microbacterium gallinarum]
MRTSSWGRRALATLAASAIIVTGSLFTASAAHAAPLPPDNVRVMAALGDSITQASMTCSSLLNCPANSWATGSTTSVNSQLLRLRATAAPDNAVGYNNAVAGAASGALNTQAAKAVTQGAQYVTIEIGANDACTKTVGAMTPTATFKTNVQNALVTLSKSAAAPQVFIASVPNLLRMYEVNKSSASARLTWALLGICKSMLANPSSTKAVDVQRRAAVQQRVDEYNLALAEACAAYVWCRYDGGVVANYAFTRADISTRDYFHPSLSGQANLAAITWPKTQWAS